MINNQKQEMDVIIPVYRPGEKFLRLLERLSEQSVPIGKLILINTEERFWTKAAEEKLREILKQENAVRSAELHHIKKEQFDHAATRSFGVSCSEAECFVCMTDDAVPADAGLLAALREGLTQSEAIAMAYARQLPDADCRPAERYTRQFNYPETAQRKGAADLPRLGIKTYFASNVCCAYRRDIFEALGGFCSDAIFNEDMIYAHSAVTAGYQIAYCPSARVIHSHNYTAMQQLRRNFDLGVSQAMHPEVFSGVPAEGEGLRLVRATADWLLKNGMAAELPRLVVQSGCKYAGYRLGKAWRRLPQRLCLWLSMNRQYLLTHPKK